ncbi:hypothetical protein MEQU1_001130 [Malassezia equina]|uniref:Ysc84 actin-binding domain-containing protein n=1 Tax=Malassezia equina TaxID=1381935 RepID=A0AAF0EDJ7_9BASI|nr:hypothetical protein MEQU1_001130 [Malassezia equina]
MSSTEPPPTHKDNLNVPKREFREKEKSRFQKFGESLVNKGIAISDWAAGYVNGATHRLGAERFMPSTNDFPLEVEKCTRILLIRDAKGICIYSSMKSGLPPFGGMNGTGLLLGRLPDGSWSAPSAILPNYYSTGFMIGLDVVDVILIINTDEMLRSFRTHKFALGVESVVSSGPLGTALNTAVDVKEKVSPVYSYVNSHGFYAGLELTGQVFLDRFDENERVYYWPGIKAGDILDGKVRIPGCVAPLHRALCEAEFGIAQAGVLEQTQIMKNLPKGPSDIALEKMLESLQDGEHIQLPPTPEQLDLMERAGFQDEYDEALEQKEREAIRSLPPPPQHPITSRVPSAKGRKLPPPVSKEQTNDTINDALSGETQKEGNIE